ncbi:MULTISPECIES: hypothetical protein [Anaerotruncus]|jgi:hypothetical protein|uniref:hypothetical protein n=1 Tax=Anaerotruncus TaxID=244127 RepID=UPI0008317E40|nr:MULTISPECIES: hypothetical protein [Anaerotruncus]RGX55760.1 hypothetical protein DWV16_06920 [Anaerotruncus sp. AF02-27]
MATDSTGVVGASGLSGELVADAQAREAAQAAGSQPSGQPKRQQPTQQQMTGEGAQFVYAAATVANILCDNLSQTQINLLANFLSVITTCVYAILTVENPNELLSD